MLTEIKIHTIDGSLKKLEDYIGKVILIVNVASKCVNTAQYEGLEDLYKKYKSKGFEILAFPCNDFGSQEPGSHKEIFNFCKTNYNITFQLFEKIHAIGDLQHPLYSLLTKSCQPNVSLSGNFEKFLINREGDVVDHFHYSVKPDDSRLTSAIESLL
jgi:glutathione peroxidase